MWVDSSFVVVVWVVAMTDKDVKEIARNIYNGQALTIFHYRGNVDKYVSDLIELGDENRWLDDLTHQDRIELQCQFEILIEEELRGEW